MNAKNDRLWDRIESQPIGPQSAVLGFPRRLARDNGWSEAHASRVLLEYRRFLFLAARAGHPVTPSDAVDQAWHLHLIYSDDYWNTWCGEVLGFPFHHGPTRGGTTEQAKYTDWYARTLASYETCFGEPPRRDIWPTVEDRFTNASAFRRVNTREVWILHKPSFQSLFRGTAAAIAVLGFTGCGALAVTDWNVFDWTGYPFLALYLVLMGAALTVLLTTRWLRGTASPAAGSDANTRLENEDPYVVAGLVDGARGILQAGLAALAARGLIESHPATPAWIGRSKNAQPGNLTGIEAAIWEAIPADREIEFRTLRKELKPHFAKVRENVQARGWEPSTATLNTARLWRALLVLAVVGIGIAKIAVGISRDRPVGFLVVLTLATLLFGLILAFRIPRRTRSGEALVNRSRTEEAEIRQSLREPSLSPEWSLPMMVALFGGTALAGTTLASWQRPLERPVPRPGTTSTDSSGGCSGAWSDTSSSSGSSDGGSDGGGDGGSGCGGCGGCGGGGD
jgi:uncharacterized protein (TIGR04222 family)